MTSKEYNEFCDKMLELERAQKACREEIQQLFANAKKEIDNIMKRHQKKVA